MAGRNKSARSASQSFDVRGAHAVLGMDIVSFSKLHEDDQIQAIEKVSEWINAALAFHGIKPGEYRWSPAGDGGYLTFASPQACRKAIDVVFAICQRLAQPDWQPRNREKLQMKLALHSGTVREAQELGRETNVWGMGINMAARILSITCPSQLLVSKQYFDTYIKGQRESEFEIGEVHWRTVKHGHQLEVMNADHHGLCLSEQQARDRRWQAVGGLWRKVSQEYEFLIHDTMKSSEPVAALAAAKFLLQLHAQSPVFELCRMIGRTDDRPPVLYPPVSHELFSQMPPEVLFQVVEAAKPRPFAAGDVLCERGCPATSCFFPVSGTMAVEIPGQERPIRIPPGQIVGEFSLWISNIARTARIRALDDGLLLEFETERFKQILAKVPHVADIIHGLIRSRIVDNVLKSKELFPVNGQDFKKAFDGVSLTCERYDPGTELDLTRWTYILFTGRVQIKPNGSSPLNITAAGLFGAEEVIGIISDVGSPDGSAATVLDETVAVRVPHDALREFQRTDAVRRKWNALYGQRIGEIHRDGNGQVQSSMTAALQVA